MLISVWREIVLSVELPKETLLSISYLYPIGSNYLFEMGVGDIKVLYFNSLKVGHRVNEFSFI